MTSSGLDSGSSGGWFSAAARMSARQTSTPPALTNARVNASARSALGAAHKVMQSDTTRAHKCGHLHPERKPTSAVAVSSAAPPCDWPPCTSVDTAATSSSINASLSSVAASRTDPFAVDAASNSSSAREFRIADPPVVASPSSRLSAPAWNALSAGDR